LACRTTNLPEVLQTEFESKVIRKLTWRLVPFLFLLYVVAYLDRINVSFAALQMQRELNFNDAVYGFGAGLFFVGYFCFQVPSNVVLQRVGARRWIALLMIVWGFVSTSMLQVRTVTGFYGLRFLLGAAEAGFFPGVILYLRNWFPDSARARTIARFMTAAPIAGVIGSPVSGALLNLHQRWGLSGWQWLFLMEGIPAILLGAVVWIYLTDRVREAPWLEDEERIWLLGALEPKTQAEGNSGRTSTFEALLDLRMWMLALVYFGLTTVMYGIGLWLPTLIHSLSGMGNFGIGLLSAVPYLAAAVSMVLVGLHSDYSRERRWHTALPAFIGGAALVVVAYSTSVAVSVAAISVALLCAFSSMGPFWAMPTAVLSGTTAAVGIALINSVGNLGGLAGPWVIGAIKKGTGTFHGGILVVASGLVVAGAIVLVINLYSQNPVNGSCRPHT
jgi:MFS transporter, ACS family, tartrate transporter